MPRKGKDFELAYAWLYDLDKDKYKVTHSAQIYDKTEGRKREVDVLIEYNDESGNLRKIAVECRSRQNKEDSTWIEQLKTKKEDLELDYLIAITTKKFSKGAIAKARYHGIIIEEAEYLDKKILDNVSSEFMIDLLFMRFEVAELKFLINKEIVSLKTVISKIGLIDKCTLLSFINKSYYYTIDPNSLMEKYNIDNDYFFDNIGNYLIINHDMCFEDNIPEIIKKLKIDRMYISIKIIPHRVSLPLNKSLSVFDVDPKNNKKYSAYFGSEDEFVVIGYLDNAIINKIQLKERKYHRFIGANMKINTVFPRELDNSKIDMEELVKKGLGEFDLRKIV